MRREDHIGMNVFRRITTMIAPRARPMTMRGLSLSALSFSLSKYLIRPADDWKPPLFSFFAMMRYKMETV